MQTPEDAGAHERAAKPERDPSSDAIGVHDPKERVADVVTRQLREAIVTGRLRPGLRLRQEALAREAGTSRVPIREALRQLQNEGLVVVIPRRGATVARLDWGDADELYRMREACEGLAILESAGRLSQEALSRIGELEARMSLLTHEDAARDPREWLAWDREFHLLTYSAAPFPRLLGLVDALWNASQAYRRVIYRGITQREAKLVHAQHALLLDALRRGDGMSAQRILVTHLRRARDELEAKQHLFADAMSAKPDDRGRPTDDGGTADER